MRRAWGTTQLGEPLARHRDGSLQLRVGVLPQFDEARVVLRRIGGPAAGVGDHRPAEVHRREEDEPGDGDLGQAFVPCDGLVEASLPPQHFRARPAYAPLVDPAVFQFICTVDWAPTPALADQLLVADPSAYTTSGETSIYRVREGSSSKGQPLVTFDDYVRVMDLHWLPDGTGFMVARQTALLDESVNLYEFDFATRTLTQITNFSGESVRRFALSPDGRSIVFERVTELTGPSNLWTMRRDGSELRLLARGGEAPAW